MRNNEAKKPSDANNLTGEEYQYKSAIGKPISDVT
jgi:hypothetical protein